MTMINTMDVFPTRIMKFDCSDQISAQDTEQMTQDVDHMISQEIYLQLTPQSPRYQSMPVLFNPDIMTGQHWARLAQVFVDCCFNYIQQTPDFVRQPNNLTLTGVRGWFFKSYDTINALQETPWHDHSPALLTGVFYLRVPGDHTREGGTMFRDPRGAGSCVSRDVEVAPQDLCWVIFPGWLSHRGHVCDTHDPRYVIAADCYVKVNS